MLPHKHTKEGVLNEKLALKKLLTYMKSVYKIPQKIKGLSDERKRKPIPLFNIVMPVLIFLMLQYESFHTIFSAPESMEKRPKNCIVEKSQKFDAVRDLLSRIDPKEIEEIHAQTIDVLKRNRVFREGTIGDMLRQVLMGGIIQQYKKVLSRLPEPEERDGEDRILSSKCGMYDGRKIAACDLWAGNAETQRWFRKR